MKTTVLLAIIFFSVLIYAFGVHYPTGIVGLTEKDGAIGCLCHNFEKSDSVLVWIEGPDSLGGFTRYYELPEIVRIAAPVYLKFGLRNAPNIYPSGAHLENAAVQTARERVHRALIGAEMLARYAPELAMSAAGTAGLGIPVPGNHEA